MKLIILVIYLVISTSGVQTQSNKSILDKVKPHPSLKKAEATAAEAPPSTTLKRYDPTRNVTYVSVNIPLLGESVGRLAGRENIALTSNMSLIFQLVYKGSSTADLTTAYLIIESVSAKNDQGEELSSVKQALIAAEGYQYNYERIDYKTEAIEAKSNSRSAFPLKKEILIFRLMLDDLPQIANSNKVNVTLGKQKYVIKSMQLSELRGRLIAS